MEWGLTWCVTLDPFKKELNLWEEGLRPPHLSHDSGKLLKRRKDHVM